MLKSRPTHLPLTIAAAAAALALAGCGDKKVVTVSTSASAATETQSPQTTVSTPETTKSTTSSTSTKAATPESGSSGGSSPAGLPAGSSDDIARAQKAVDNYTPKGKPAPVSVADQIRKQAIKVNVAMATGDGKTACANIFGAEKLMAMYQLDKSKRAPKCASVVASQQPATAEAKRSMRRQQTQESKSWKVVTQGKRATIYKNGRPYQLMRKVHGTWMLDFAFMTSQMQGIAQQVQAGAAK